MRLNEPKEVTEAREAGYGEGYAEAFEHGQIAARNAYNEGAREQQVVMRKQMAELIRSLKDQGLQKACSPPCYSIAAPCDTYEIIKEAMEDAWRIAALAIEKGPV